MRPNPSSNTISGNTTPLPSHMSQYVIILILIAFIPCRFVKYVFNQIFYSVFINMKISDKIYYYLKIYFQKLMKYQVVTMNEIVIFDKIIFIDLI